CHLVKGKRPHAGIKQDLEPGTRRRIARFHGIKIGNEPHGALTLVTNKSTILVSENANFRRKADTRLGQGVLVLRRALISIFLIGIVENIGLSCLNPGSRRPARFSPLCWSASAPRSSMGLWAWPMA